MYCSILVCKVGSRRDQLGLKLRWQILWFTRGMIRRTSKRTTPNLRSSAYLEDMNNCDYDEQPIQLSDRQYFEGNTTRLTLKYNHASWCNRPNLLIKVRCDHSCFKRLSLVECDRWGDRSGKGTLKQSILFSFSFTRSRILRICIREDKKVMKQCRTNKIIP